MMPYRQRVLLIDDDDDMRDVLECVLKDEGYYVAVLDGGAGALDSVRAQRPQLVVLDVVMPEVDGVQVLSQLRAVGYTMPVLLITGMPLSDPRFDGADALLAKPFDLDDLIGTVRRLIGPVPPSVV